MNTHPIQRHVLPLPRRGKAEQAETAFARMLVEASQRGFHGRLSLTLVVQDGHIQYVTTSSERTLK